MKILLMHNQSASDLPSGESVVFDSEAKALRKAGCEVHQHIQMRSGGVVGRLRQANVFWSRRAYAIVRKLIEQHKPDLAHFHGLLPDLTISAVAACNDSRVPVIQTLHNYRWLCVEGGLFRNAKYCDDCIRKGPFKGIKHRCSRGSILVSGLLTANNRWLRANGRLVERVDRFVAVSEFVKDKHIAAGFPPGKLEVKYNGVSIPSATDQKHPNAEARADQRSRPFRVSFVGRLDIAKGTGVIAELPELAKSSFPMVLRIVGGGPDEKMLRTKLGHRDDVEFVGQVAGEKVCELILQSDCVLVPSLVPETFGLVAAEAMACGVPVVASKIGGLSELVEASGGGLTVEPHAGPTAFAEALQSLAQAASKRSRLGKLGREFAQSKLDIHRTTGELIRIYQDVLSEGRVTK